MVRERDFDGRPRNARPRDALGRPLPRGSEGVAEDPAIAELIATAGPDELLAAAQALLDAGRPFEAHEVLEAGWKRAPSPERGLWRALAQLAVGVTHRLRGNAEGAEALFIRATETLDALSADGPAREAAERLRIDLDGLARGGAAPPPGQVPRLLKR